MTDSNDFVADGFKRAQRANEPAIREQVESEFAALLNNATWLKRREIRKQIEAEINRRCDELAPPDALY